MDQALNVIAAGFAAVWAFFGLKGLFLVLLGGALYHWSLKLFPERLRWFLDGLKRAEDKARDEFKG